MSAVGAVGSFASAGRLRSAGGVWRSKTWRIAVSSLVVALVVLVVPEFLGPSSSMHLTSTLKPPSWAHPFGTDEFGRDVLTRVLVGARVSWMVGLAAAVFSVVLGAVVGGIAAIAGGWMDTLLMRSVDIVLAFPATLLAIVLAMAMGPGIWTVIVVVSFVYAAPVSRLVRGLVLREAGLEYVQAARQVGSSRRRVLGYHIGINVVPTLVVYQMTVAADAILVEAGLSYLGVGVRPPTPSWGAMIQEGQQLIFSGDWWVSFFPGIAIALTALALNALADSVLADISLER